MLTPKEALRNLAMAVREVRATLEEHELLQASVATLMKLVEPIQQVSDTPTDTNSVDKK